MGKIKCTKTKFLTLATGFFFLLSAFMPLNAFAVDELQMLKQQLEVMSQQMKVIQEKLKALESKNTEKADEIKEIDDRLSKAEIHTATDRISFGVELRTKAESIHYNDLRVAPSTLISAFFASPPAGFNGATLAQAQAMIAGMAASGSLPPPNKFSANNDAIFTNRFRLDMKAKVNDNLNFAGRLAAYKVFGDSTGIQFYQGSMGNVAFDGTTSSIPHGDTIHLERAYFNYHRDIGKVPVNFSLGRRPATEGPPAEYKSYSLEGGSPLATIINWQFDGASLNLGLEDIIGIPGSALKFCYGVGFERDWGNTSTLSATSDVKDVHLAGFIATLYDDDNTSAVLNYSHAWDITDGFTGLTVMPFIAYKEDRDGDGTYEYYFDKNYGGYVSRVEPMTNIGDWDAASLLLRTNLGEWFDTDIDLFLAGSWSHTDPSNISENPFYELMGQGLLSSNGDLDSHDGYNLYAGAIFPMPFDARLGLEYNWGSRYWFNFTGAEDSLIGSKLATRGQVYEAYYIQPVFGQNFFFQLGTQFYNYKYTGSGNPLGKPVKLSQAGSLDTFFPVPDEIWNLYLSATLRF